jgi:hypothetical protein
LVLDPCSHFSQAAAPQLAHAGCSKAQAHLSSFRRARPSIAVTVNNPG